MMRKEKKMITVNANSLTADAETVGPHVALLNAHAVELERIVHHANLTVAKIKEQRGLQPTERAGRCATICEAAAQALASVEVGNLKKLNAAKDDAAKTNAIALVQQSTRQATAAAGKTPRATLAKTKADQAGQKIIYLSPNPTPKGGGK